MIARITLIGCAMVAGLQFVTNAGSITFSPSFHGVEDRLRESTLVVIGKIKHFGGEKSAQNNDRTIETPELTVEEVLKGETSLRVIRLDVNVDDLQKRMFEVYEGSWNSEPWVDRDDQLALKLYPVVESRNWPTTPSDQVASQMPSLVKNGWPPYPRVIMFFREKNGYLSPFYCLREVKGSTKEDIIGISRVEQARNTPEYNAALVALIKSESSLGMKKYAFRNLLNREVSWDFLLELIKKTPGTFQLDGNFYSYAVACLCDHDRLTPRPRPKNEGVVDVAVTLLSLAPDERALNDAVKCMATMRDKFLIKEHRILLETTLRERRAFLHGGKDELTNSDLLLLHAIDKK